MYASRFAAALGLVFLAACGGNEEPPMDASLSGDLALASSSQPYPQQQFMSPMEQQGYAPVYAQPVASRGGYSQPVVRTQPRPRTTSTSTSTGSGQIVRRNTRRDAVIGATAGAVIGATTSRNKTKGAIIGAAAGAVIGGIVGHTVDVERQ